MGGHRRRVLEPHRDLVIELIERTPHLTVQGHRDILQDRGISVSRHAVWQFLRREGLSFKKLCSLLNKPGRRSPVAGAVLAGRARSERLAFIDETWIKTNMAPIRGWGPKGRRLRGYAPHGHWQTMTFLAALRYDQLTAPFGL